MAKNSQGVMSFDKPNSPETGSGLPAVEKDSLFTSQNTGARFENILTYGEEAVLGGISQSNITGSEYEKKRKRDEEDRQNLFMTLAKKRLEELQERLSDIYEEQEETRKDLEDTQKKLKEKDAELAKHTVKLTAIETVENFQQSKQILNDAEKKRKIALQNGEPTHQHDAHCQHYKQIVAANEAEAKNAQENLIKLTGEKIPIEVNPSELSVIKVEVTAQKNEVYFECKNCEYHIQIQTQKLQNLGEEATAINNEILERKNENSNDRTLTQTFKKADKNGMEISSNLAKAAEELTGIPAPQGYNSEKAAKMENIKSRVDHGQISAAELSSLTDGMSLKNIASIEISLQNQGITIAPLSDNVPHAEHVPISSIPKSGPSELQNQFASSAAPVIEPLKAPELSPALNAKQYSMIA